MNFPIKIEHILLLQKSLGMNLGNTTAIITVDLITLTLNGFLPKYYYLPTQNILLRCIMFLLLTNYRAVII